MPLRKAISDWVRRGANARHVNTLTVVDFVPGLTIAESSVFSEAIDTKKGYLSWVNFATIAYADLGCGIRCLKP